MDIVQALFQVGIVALSVAAALFVFKRSGRSFLTSVQPFTLATAAALLIGTALAVRLVDALV